MVRGSSKDNATWILCETSKAHIAGKWEGMLLKVSVYAHPLVHSALGTLSWPLLVTGGLNRGSSVQILVWLFLHTVYNITSASQRIIDAWKWNNNFFSLLVTEKASQWPLCTSQHLVLGGDFMSSAQFNFRKNSFFYFMSYWHDEGDVNSWCFQMKWKWFHLTKRSGPNYLLYKLCPALVPQVEKLQMWSSYSLTYTVTNWICLH